MDKTEITTELNKYGSGQKDFVFEKKINDHRPSLSTTNTTEGLKEPET
jgi:hypothetical protein